MYSFIIMRFDSYLTTMSNTNSYFWQKRNFMADLNEVRLIGRLTRDPELRAIPTGTSIATFGLATSHRFKGQDGVMREETTFVDITCWGKTAENVAKYCKKGKLVFVGGRLKFDSWEDKQTSQKRSRLTVVAENIQFLDRRDEGAPPQSMDPVMSATSVSEDIPTSDWPTPPNPPISAPIPPKQPTQPKTPSMDPSGWEPPDVGEPPF